MSIYRCSSCDNYIDNDHWPCSEFQNGLICPDCEIKREENKMILHVNGKVFCKYCKHYDRRSHELEHTCKINPDISYVTGKEDFRLCATKNGNGECKDYEQKN
jgi:hypothetical protein